VIVPALGASRRPSVRPRKTLADARDRGKELLRVRILGRVKERANVGLLHQLALVHHCHPVGEIRHDAHVVGDQDNGSTELVPDSAQQVQNLGLHCHVESGGGLVGHDHTGLKHERLSDDDALLLAAGELVRVVVDAHLGIGDPDAAHHINRRSPRVFLGDLLVGVQTLGDLPPDGEHGVERC